MHENHISFFVHLNMHIRPRYFFDSMINLQICALQHMKRTQDSASRVSSSLMAANRFDVLTLLVTMRAVQLYPLAATEEPFPRCIVVLPWVATLRHSFFTLQIKTLSQTFSTR